jgi:hypothetical protein
MKHLLVIFGAWQASAMSGSCIPARRRGIQAVFVENGESIQKEEVERGTGFLLTLLFVYVLLYRYNSTEL